MTTLLDRLSSSPEKRLILQACRPYPDDEDAERLRVLARQDVDWTSVIRWSAEFKVLPLVSRNLRAAAEGLLPEAVEEELLRRFESNAFSNLLRSAELLRILRLLSQRGISSMSFKGPVLAQMLYGDLSLRQYGDLDVLIAPGQVTDAVEVLQTDGYLRRYPSEFFSARHVRGFMRFFDLDHVALVNLQRRTRLEIHWCLARRSVYSASQMLIRDTIRIPHGGLNITTLSPDALLLYLCVHGCKHRWRRLSWVCDLAAFAHRFRDLDWDRAWWLAVSTGAARRLCLGFHLAEQLLQTRLPGRIRTEVDRRLDRLQDLGRTSLMLQPFQSDARVLSGVRAHTRMLERGWDKIIFAVWMLLAPKPADLDGKPLPAALFILYYVLRPGRLLRIRVMRLLGRNSTVSREHSRRRRIDLV